MKKEILIFLGFIVWSVSFYHHFHNNHRRNIMVSFVGNEHCQMFSHMFQDYGDLWAFGHRSRRSLSNIRFEKRGTHFEHFGDSTYEHMLIVNKLMHVPMMFDSDKIVRYLHENVTIASLWPNNPESFPETNNMNEWFDLNDNYIEKIYL